MSFIPNQVYFEKEAEKYPLCQTLIDKFYSMKIPVEPINEFKKIDWSQKTPQEFYSFSKKTIILAVNKNKKLEQCKPSADYQFSVVSGCPGGCEYCYLQTNNSLKPYIRIYVNIEDILDNIELYIKNNAPNITTFELASSGDPLSVEYLTHSIKKVIEFFSISDYGRLRLVTKYSDIDNLLNINHNKKTTIRFSLNSEFVFKNFEHNTDSIEERIIAASKIYNADYPLGFILAPIMYYDGWDNEYYNLLKNLKYVLKASSNANLTFELIQYRFTLKSKDIIQKRFSNTKLDLNEFSRIKKWGPYGAYKYVYPKEIQLLIKNYLYNIILELFPCADIKYFT